ncbi:class A sortase [Enterococcus sp. AZ150]|uniref:class A sortase n=1 Tax=Enterococcus sp. AZ150 TaxID=2774866 RepID=UPI003F6A0772
MMKQNKRSKFFLEFCVTSLMIMSLILLTYPAWKERIISQQISMHFIKKFSNELPKILPEEEKIHSLSAIDSLKQAKPKELIAYGAVQIPELNWIQPLYVGMTNENLFYGGVVMFPERTLQNDNFVIFGHHLGIQELLFGQILKAKIGQNIIVSYLGKTQTYTISETSLINEKDVDILDIKTQSMLTLFTCPTPTITSQRFMIRAYPSSITSQSFISEKRQLEEVKQYQQQNVSLKKSYILVFLIICLLIILLNRILFFKYLR